MDGGFGDGVDMRESFCNQRQRLGDSVWNFRWVVRKVTKSHTARQGFASPNGVPNDLLYHDR